MEAGGSVATRQIPKSASQSRDEHAYTLLRVARDHCAARRLFDALDALWQAIPLCRQVSTSQQAAVLHNSGHCLHALGEFGAARPYYIMALSILEKASRTSHVWTHRDVNKSRILFIRERLVDVTFQRLPAPEYLDELGRKRSTPLILEGRRQNARSRESEAGALLDDAWLPPRTAPLLNHEPEPPHAAAPCATDVASYLEEPSAASSSTESAAESVCTAAEAHQSTDESVSAPSDVHRSGAELEVARTAWLQDYIRRREWAKAAALVVNSRERQHLAVERATSFWTQGAPAPSDE